MQVDEQIWTFLKAKDKRAASHCTKQNIKFGHIVYIFTMFEEWAVVMLKRKKKRKKKQRNKTESCCHFSLAL